ncbi:MAG: hypothetical protein AB1726_01455 [Planctomycetota bacterium]
MTAGIARLVLSAGVSLGTIGAAGFAPPIEPRAWLFFLLGIAGTLGGGLVLRRTIRRRASGGAGGLGGRAELAAALDRLAGEVDRLAAERAALDARVLGERIDALLSGPYFELGARNEEYSRALGAGSFARIWAGFAVSERLLARAWSMTTDGHLEEARAELPRASAEVRRAAGIPR